MQDQKRHKSHDDKQPQAMEHAYGHGVGAKVHSDGAHLRGTRRGTAKDTGYHIDIIYLVNHKCSKKTNQEHQKPKQQRDP